MKHLLPVVFRGGRQVEEQKLFYASSLYGRPTQNASIMIKT